MSEWWEKPYAGGPMVPVPGFPRPLYPPDAKGKTPSVDGPDVLAYKRVVARAGRWPWDPPSWDDSFSNAFSHGKSGNVGETGIAGVQRQQNLDPTGYVGEKTFNTLRSIRVPTGPHAGEMAMDAYAQSLLVQAWEEFGGAEPEPPPAQSLRSLALQKAISQLGAKESPPNSNRTKYGDWYGMTGPWCAIFVTWCYEQAGDSPSFVRGANYAYVPYVVSDGYAKRNGLSVTSSPVAGDLVCFDWGRDGVYDHIGLFEAWGGTSPSQFTAIEGNTSVTSDSDGGEVMRRMRDTRSQGTVFVRVREP